MRLARWTWHCTNQPTRDDLASLNLNVTPIPTILPRACRQLRDPEKYRCGPDATTRWFSHFPDRQSHLPRTPFPVFFFFSPRTRLARWRACHPYFSFVLKDIMTDERCYDLWIMR